MINIKKSFRNYITKKEGKKERKRDSYLLNMNNVIPVKQRRQKGKIIMFAHNLC